MKSPCAGWLPHESPGKPQSSSPAQAPYPAGLRKVGRHPPLAPAGCPTPRRASRNRPRRHRLLTRRACARLVATLPLRRLAVPQNRRASRNRPRRHRPLTRRACARLVAILPLRRLAAPHSAGQAEIALAGTGSLLGEPAQGWTISRPPTLAGANGHRKAGR